MVSKKSLLTGLVIFLAGFLIIHVFLFCGDAFWGGERLKAENAAQWGDFIGGYIGTIFAPVGVLLLVVTLFEQIQKDKAEGFETRFFQLLDYHRENTAAIGIGDKYGLRTFVTLLREFRLVLRKVDEACRGSRKFHHPEREDKPCLRCLLLWHWTKFNSVVACVSGAL